DIALTEEHEGVKLEAVFVRHGPPRRADHRVEIDVLMIFAQLEHGDEPLLCPLAVALLDGERSAAAGAQRRVTRLDGALDILGVMVAPADDDDVLASACDVELAVVEEAEVPGAQVRAIAVVRAESAK